MGRSRDVLVHHLCVLARDSQSRQTEASETAVYPSCKNRHRGLDDHRANANEAAMEQGEQQE